MKGLSKTSLGGRARPAMNVTPLVDIVLVLLIIFMVVLPNSDPGAAVELPRVDVGEAEDEDEPYTLSIGRDGRLFFEAEALSESRFLETLRRAHAENEERAIVLRADRTVPYGRVRTIFRHAQEVGFPGIRLRTSVATDEAVASR